MKKENIPYNKILYISIGFLFFITFKNSCNVGRINDTLIENNYNLNRKIDSLQKLNELIIKTEFEKQNVILGFKLDIKTEKEKNDKLNKESENKSKTIINLQNQLKNTK